MCHEYPKSIMLKNLEAWSGEGHIPLLEIGEAVSRSPAVSPRHAAEGAILPGQVRLATSRTPLFWGDLVPTQNHGSSFPDDPLLTLPHVSF